MDTLQVQMNDFLVSFDVVTFILKVVIRDSLILNWQFDEDSVRLFHHVLTTSFFFFNSQFYEQMDGIAVGSLLSLDW